MIAVSEKYSLNPSVELCFYCNKEKGVVLLGANRGVEAPRQAVYNHEPCQDCAKLMKRGVILISVDEKKSTVREHTCRRCTHVWRAPIRMAKAAANLSGEMTETCPKCNTYGQVNSSPHMLDNDNPWRTGGWIVVTDQYIKRVFTPPELVESVLKKRVAFMPDETWDLLKLPRGATKESETTNG